MSARFYKKLKLFKGKEVVAKRAENHSSLSNTEKGLGFWRDLGKNPFVFALLFVAAIAYLIAYIPSRSLRPVKEGEIATSDIVAPSDLTIEDTEATAQKREEAVESVLPVYMQDPNVALNTEEKIRGLFNSGRVFLEERATTKRILQFKTEIKDRFNFDLSAEDTKALIKTEFSETYEETLINLILKTSEKGIILSKNLFIHGEEEKGLTLIKGKNSETVFSTSDILDIKESKKDISAGVAAIDIASAEKTFLQDLAFFFIEPNITYDRLETERRQARARSGVGPVFYTIKKGKVIVRKGDEVSSEAVKQVEIINQNLQSRPSWLRNFSGTFLLFALLLITVWYYMKSLLKFDRAIRDFIMLGITLIIGVLIYKLSFFLSDTFSTSARLSILKHTSSYYYAFPYQFGTLLFAFLTNIPIALVYTIVNSLLVGYFFKSNFLLVIFSLIGGFSAIYGIKYYGKRNRTTTFQTGIFLIAPVNAFIIITFHLIGEKLGAFDVFISEVLLGVVGGLLSAALAFLLLPVFENLFDIATQTKLVELTNSDLPIFRQMAMEAPGSYHHSLIVASLAEKAAEEIKVDPIVAKAGALYHDIGKIKMPEYFIENKGRTLDRHKDLTPSMSTLVIVKHVKEGVDRAKKLKLPKILRDIIEQHHGNSLVRYFFEKAKEQYDPEMQTVGEESYRYSGPRPKTKEAALVMVADSVEAASRSLKSPTKTNLKRVITEIINNYLQDGQLDDCDFSLRELKIAGLSFVNTLYMIYHHRVEYPGFAFEGKNKQKKENNTKTANDRNLKPAT